MPKGIKVIMYGTLTSKDYSGDFLLRYTAVEQSFKEHRGRRTLAPWQSVVKAEQQVLRWVLELSSVLKQPTMSLA
ncbi:uncharacterized protein LOC144298368 isoform X3 [Canis aureus]